MVRLTDRPDMTLDVYRGRKTTIQYNTIQLWFEPVRDYLQCYCARMTGESDLMVLAEL